MKSYKSFLTNEELSRRFDNPFALVNYAINLAKTMISRGESLDSNPAVDVINAIEENRDIDIEEEENEEEDEIEIDVSEVTQEV